MSLAVNDDRVLTVMRPTQMDGSVRALLPRDATVRQALDLLRNSADSDPDTQRVVQQLARECAGGAFCFLDVSNGQVVRVPPSTPVGQIAVPQQIRTASGELKRICGAVIEVESYAKVGWEVA